MRRLTRPLSLVLGLLLLPLLLLATGCRKDGPAEGSESVAPAAEVDVAAHRAEVDAWHEGRVERLEREDGWLSLVGLLWLPDGASTLGSAEDADLRLPETAPETVGVVTLLDGVVTFAPAEGLDATVDDVAIEEAKALRADTHDEGPEEVRFGSYRFYPIERDGRVGLRVKDAESDVRRHFEGIDRFPVDPAWRLEARFEPSDGETVMMVPNILGTPTEEVSPGRVVIEKDGQELSIDALDGGPDELFLVFGDTTNGETTYGGGRFLYVPRADEAGRLIVDFNRAYNPPCVFTDYATCPLPPKQNRLPVAVEAGEKMWGEMH